MKPEPDFGTDEIRWRKSVAAGEDTVSQVTKRGFKAREQKPEQRDDTDLSPMGILLARKLISDRQHGLAVQFLALHGQVFAAAPKLQGNAMFNALPSCPSKLDVPRTPLQEIEEWESRRDRYNKIMGGLSLPQAETIRNLVIDRQVGRQDIRVFSDIINLNVTGREILCRTGAKAPIHIQRRIEAIRNALDRLRSPRKTAWGDMSEAHQNALSSENTQPA